MGRNLETAGDTSAETPDDASCAPFGAEIVRTKGLRVACDGGTAGHPQVWLNLGDDERVVCPYCSRIFVLEGSRHDRPYDNGSE